MKMVRQTRRNISEDPIEDQTYMCIVYILKLDCRERHKDSSERGGKKKNNKQKKPTAIAGSRLVFPDPADNIRGVERKEQEPYCVYKNYTCPDTRESTSLANFRS